MTSTLRSWWRWRWRNRRGRHVTFFEPFGDVHGGAQRALVLAADGLRERGWSTDVVFPGDGTVADRVRATGVQVSIALPPHALRRMELLQHRSDAVRGIISLPRYWVLLARRFRRVDGVVQVHDQRGMVLAGPAAILARRPIVWHIHAINPTSLVNRLGARVADRVVVPSRTALRRMPEIERRLPAVAIPYAVEPGRAIAVERGSAPELVTVGRLHPHKGYDVLLHAMALLLRTVPDANVVVAGGPVTSHPDLKDELLELARRLGVDSHVQFVGYVNEPTELWSTAAAYVQPSREASELLPIAVLEALASGLPVVATDVGAVSDMVQHDRTGLLVPPEDPVALAAALERVLTDPALAARLAEAAPKAMAEVATVDNLVGSLADVYESLLHPPATNGEA